MVPPSRRRIGYPDAASWVTGETFVIDSGQRLGDAERFRKEAFGV